jgi:hypothetical protein
VTALMAWPNFYREMEERSTNRWQHRLKREHPTCTERVNRSLRVRMEGWRQGCSGRRTEGQRKDQKIASDHSLSFLAEW